MKRYALPLTALLCLSFIFIACSKQSSNEGELEHEEHEHESGSSIVQLDKHKVYHAGITTGAVEKKSIAIPLTLPGTVGFNERKRQQISARIAGRIEKKHVVTNDIVAKGETLVELYSPDFLALQTEFLIAYHQYQSSKVQSNQEQEPLKTLYLASRYKLTVIGMQESDIEELERLKAPLTYLKVRSPIDGVIIDEHITAGAEIGMGSEMFEVADLSTVWILIDIHEKDLPHIAEGMKAEIVFTPYQEQFFGTISSIFNTVDEATRTTKARIEVRNPKRLLKPGMFCSVKIQTAMGGKTIKIPASALLGETEKHFVFIAIDDTTFEKRDVRTGVENRDFAEILDGLIEGESIVIKGGFFLKSELAKETFGEEH